MPIGHSVQNIQQKLKVKRESKAGYIYLRRICIETESMRGNEIPSERVEKEKKS